MNRLNASISQNDTAALLEKMKNCDTKMGTFEKMCTKWGGSSQF